MTEPPNALPPGAIGNISARATTIQERLEGKAIAQQSGNFQTATKNFDLWRKLATNDDESSTAALLEDLGHSPQTITPFFGRVTFPLTCAAPLWTKDLTKLINSFTAQHESISSQFIHLENPIPFEDILKNIVHSASEDLAQITRSSSNIISEEAFSDMQRHLLVQLSELLSPILIAEFEHFRLKNQPLVSILSIPGSHTSRDQYNAFIEALRESEMLRLLTQKPVLCRLMATMIQQWVGTSRLFISRLSLDWQDIFMHFAMQASPVQRIACGLSDQHNEGQTVYKVQFKGGRSLLYKPKPLGLDAAWHSFLVWLKENGLDALPIAPKVLPRGPYGWAEWMQPESYTEEEAKNFFQKAGALLCLVYLLQGTDCHFENIVTCGGSPALVDLETLFHPWLKESTTPGSHQALLKAKRKIRDSVLATGYLPTWTVIPGGQLAGEGGLNSTEDRIIRSHRFRFINTDGMVLRETCEVAANYYAPDTKLSKSLLQHTAEILHGFNRIFDFFLLNKQTICHTHGPLSYFRGKISRLLLRPTRLYFLLLIRSRQSLHLEDGTVWGASLDFLYRLSDSHSMNSTLKAIIDVERKALQRSDIPLFWVSTDSVDIHSLEGTIPNAIEEPSWLQTRERIQKLSESQRIEQLDMIRYAIESSRPQRSFDYDFSSPRPLLVETTASFSPENAIAYANEIFAILRDSAIRCSGGATWIGGIPLSRSHRYQLEVLGFDLYSGTLGVALFLGALFKVTGSLEAKALALEALTPLRSDMRHDQTGRHLAYTIGIGGGAGLGSAVYTLGLLSILLNKDDLLEDAQRAAALISADRILEDKQFDVMQGCAGSILGLISLYSICNDSRVLKGAIQCGELLVSKAVSQVAGKAWPSPFSKIPLTGFSHGTAGISLALARLYVATGDCRYLALSLEGVEYERDVFSQAHQNWPDFRDSAHNPDYLSFWCHGAAGIGLARLGMLRAIPGDPRIRDEIDVALRTTIEAPPEKADHLCCGNFGRIELLFTAGIKLSIPSFVQLAQQKAASLWGRQITNGSGNSAWPAGRAKENPGFFSGISGTGYEVLRMVQPEVLPSVLLWEHSERGEHNPDASSPL